MSEVLNVSNSRRVRASNLPLLGRRASLCACRFTQDQGVATLSIMIDEPGGVKMQTCSNLSKAISMLLQVEYPQIPEKYQLNVSSPGIERPLYTAAHYQQAVNETIQVQLKRAQNGVKKFSGLLKSIENNQIILECSGSDFQFSIDDIAKAKILWNQGAKK